MQTRIRAGMAMVYLPAGQLEMGSNQEPPVHTITLDTLWMDQTEVANARFTTFLTEQGNQVEQGVRWLEPWAGSRGIVSGHIEQQGGGFRQDRLRTLSGDRGLPVRRRGILRLGRRTITHRGGMGVYCTWPGYSAIRERCYALKGRDMDITQTQNDSMTAKRVIITGPTSGIGKEIAAQLAALGAEVVLACRDLAAGERTGDEIARRTGTKNCAVMHIDTSSQQSIHEFARQYRARYPRLDVLINNAGINRSRRQVSVDGIELTFATNVLGYYLLTRDLLDLLRGSAPARIVNVASTFTTDVDLTDLQFERRTYDGRKAYSQSKACDRMLTWAFARRLEGSGVTANAMAPGLVPGTGLYRDTSPMVRLIMRLVGGFRPRSAARAADTAVWLASSPQVEGISGRFFGERREMACEFRDVQAEDKLWAICEGLTGLA